MSAQRVDAVAQEYAERGWPVFPCHTPTHVGCSCCRDDCSSPGKHPRTASGLRDATTDPGVVASWWRRWPNANIGIVTAYNDVLSAHQPFEDYPRLIRESAREAGATAVGGGLAGGGVGAGADALDAGGVVKVKAMMSEVGRT